MQHRTMMKLVEPVTIDMRNTAEVQISQHARSVTWDGAFRLAVGESMLPS